VINITIERKHALLIATFLVVAALLVPAAARASIFFDDVPDTNPFSEDITWLKLAYVTNGCGDGNYCPKDFVTREQMAAFMHRLADNQVVDAESVAGGTAWMTNGVVSPVFNEWVDETGQGTSYNSNDLNIAYRSTAIGVYDVLFNGFGKISNVQITTYDSPGGTCRLDGTAGGFVFLKCYDDSGSPADAKFTVTVMGEG
jgi:hypothetical protein